MIDLTSLEIQMKELNFDVNPKVLYGKIASFSDFLEKIPMEVEIRCPISPEPQFYAPPGRPITSFLGVLNEIRKWCDIQKNLAPMKCNQLLDAYTNSLKLCHFLISFHAARAFFETTALYKNEWREASGKVKEIESLKPSNFNFATKNKNDYDNLLSKLFDLLIILRAVKQRSRFDWQAISHEEKPKQNEETEELLRQRNVLTAINKIKMPETKYCKTTREHYEMICDFVHPNRGSNMLFIERSTPDNNFINHVYSKQPKSYELLSLVIEFTTVPISICMDEIIKVYSKWDDFGKILDKLISGVKFYEE